MQLTRTWDKNITQQRGHFIGCLYNTVTISNSKVFFCLAERISVQVHISLTWWWLGPRAYKITCVFFIYFFCFFLSVGLSWMESHFNGLRRYMGHGGRVNCKRKYTLWSAFIFMNIFTIFPQRQLRILK